MRRYTWLLLACVVPAVTMFCGKPAPKPAAPTPAGIDMSTLPEFLRYPGAVATERIPVSTPAGTGTVWTLVTTDPIAQVSDWFRASAEKAGWQKPPEMHAGQTQMLEWEKPDKSEVVKLMLYPKVGQTAISIAHRWN
uniref:Uncharacterized protein n=1 Tax=candidate division WOR-3 bacterium TaxID=2052148 RepID=A0A7C4CCW2_UNCW3